MPVEWSSRWPALGRAGRRPVEKTPRAATSARQWPRALNATYHGRWLRPAGALRHPSGGGGGREGRAWRRRQRRQVMAPADDRGGSLAQAVAEREAAEQAAKLDRAQKKVQRLARANERARAARGVRAGGASGGEPGDATGAAGINFARARPPCWTGPGRGSQRTTRSARRLGCRMAHGESVPCVLPM